MKTLLCLIFALFSGLAFAGEIDTCVADAIKEYSGINYTTAARYCTLTTVTDSCVNAEMQHGLNYSSAWEKCRIVDGYVSDSLACIEEQLSHGRATNYDDAWSRYCKLRITRDYGQK